MQYLLLHLPDQRKLIATKHLSGKYRQILIVYAIVCILCYAVI